MKARWLPILVILAAAFLPFLPAILTGKQLGPTEHIQTMVLESAPKPTYGWDVLQADGVLQFWPWRDLVFDAWKKGETPWVNPYQLCGQPLAANSQSAGFYPLHILFAFFPGSTALKMLLLGVVHGFIAGVGVYVWCRFLKASKDGALLAGCIFACSQFMVAWAPLASVPTTVAWIPWILVGLLDRDRTRGFITTGCSTALMLSAGHLQFAAYGLIIAGIAAGVELIRSRNWQNIFGLLVGLLVAYPILVPVLENSSTSHRKNIPSEEGYSAYIGGSLAGFEALSLVHPKFKGDTSGIVPEGLPNGYWPMYTKPNSNPAESALWLGPVGLTFALFGLLNRKGFLPITLAGVGLLLAFGSPLNRMLFFYFPGWSATGSPGRALIIFLIGMLPLIAIGYDQLFGRLEKDKKWLLLSLVPLLLLALGFNFTNQLGSLLAKSDEGQLTKIIAVTTQPYLGSIALSAVLGSLAIAATLKMKTPWVALVIGTVAGLPFVLSGSPVEVPKVEQTQERSAFTSKAWNLAVTPPAYLPPNLASIQRVHDAFGYDSILDGSFVNQLKITINAEPAPPENGNMMLYRGQQPEKLSQLGVSSVGGMAVDGKRIESNGSAEISYDGYDHQIIKPNGATEILVRDRYFSWISSPTPGVKIESENGWRKITCAPNTSEIRLNYKSRSILHFLPCVLLIAMCTNLLRKTKQNESNNHESS